MFSSAKIENFQIWGIKVLIFLMPLLPLFISPSMVFPFITGKNFAFRILVEFAAALWIGLIITNREYRLRNSLMVLSILTFTFIAGLANLLGVNPYNSFWSNYERMEGYVTILHLALYFVIVKSMLRTKRDWKIFFSIFLLVSVIVGLLAFIFGLDESTLSFKRYAMEYGTRMHSTIGNPPFLASYLLLSVFIGLILIFNTQKAYLKFACLLSVVFNSMVIYSTGSRGAIFAGIAGIIFGLFLICKGKNVFRKRSRVPLITGVFIALAAVFLIFHYSDFLKHDRTITRFSAMSSDPSVKSRLDAWGMALNGIKERPVLGWGQENFIGVYTVNTIPYVDEQIWMDRSHNIVMDWLVNAGFLGLFSYFAIFISAFYFIWTARNKQKIKKSEANVIVTALVVYFIQNLFIFDTINTYLIFFTLLAYIDSPGLAESPLCADTKDNISSGKTKIKSIGMTLLALMIFSFAGYYLNYKPIKQARHILQMSFSSAEDDSFSGLLNEFKEALSYDTFGNADVRGRMFGTSRFVLNRQFFDQEGAVRFIQMAVREVEKGAAFNMHNLEYLTNTIYLFKEVALYERSFIDRTEGLIKECLRINPDYQWLYAVLADVYMLKKDYESVFANLKKVVDSAPQNDKNQLKLALAAIYVSREDTVSSSLYNVRKIRTVKNKNIASGKETVFSAAELYQFASAYREVRNYQKALEYLKKLTIVLSYNDKLHLWRDHPFNEPGNRAKIHLELAKIYLSLNDKENAAKEAEKAAEIAPMKNKEKSDRIID